MGVIPHSLLYGVLRILLALVVAGVGTVSCLVVLGVGIGILLLFGLCLDMLWGEADQQIFIKSIVSKYGVSKL